MPVGPTGFTPPPVRLPAWTPPGVPMSPAQFPMSAVQTPTFAQIQAQMAGSGLPYAAPTPPPAQMFGRPGFTPPTIRPPVDSLDPLRGFMERVGQKRQMQLAAREAVGSLATRPQWTPPAITSGPTGASTAAPSFRQYAIDGAPSVNPNAARGLRSGFGVPQPSLPSISRGLPSGPVPGFTPDPRAGASFGRANLGGVGGLGGQFGTGIGRASTAPGIRGGISRFLLGPGGGGKVGAVGNLAKGGVAGLVGAGARNQLLNSGSGDLFKRGYVLTNESAPERFARAGTLGMVGGLAGGGAGVAVGGAGAGLGQLGVNTLASDNDFMAWARGENENPLYDFMNKTSSAVNPIGWAASGIHALQGGEFDPFNSTRNILGGASKDFSTRTGDELSVAHALGKVPGVGQFLGDAGPSVVDQTLSTIRDQAAPMIEQKIAERQAAAANPATISDLALRMGMDEDAAGQLGSEWAQQVEQFRVLAEQGALEVTVPDPADPNKTITRPLTADELPGYIERQFRQTIRSLPAIIAEGNATRKMEEADAMAQQEALTRAFGYSVAMNQLMGPSYDAMASNPLLAPYAGLMQQSNLNLPYLIAHDQYKDTQAQYAAEQRQIAQQEAAAQRAYEMELAKLRAKQEAEASAGELGASIGAGAVASILK